MQKIFFFDIDGTIYSQTKKTTSQETINAILKLKENGHIVCLCTGRGPGASHYFIETLKPDFFIGLNGNIIVDNNNKIFYQNHIKNEDYLQLIKFAEQHNIVYASTDGYTAGYSKYTDQLDDAFTYGTLMPFSKEDTDFHQNHQISMAFYVFEIEKNMNLVEEARQKFPHFSFVPWHKYSLDILSSTHSKKSGIEYIMKTLNLKHENTIAFGDGLNDMEMIEYVKTGIAMGNAHEQLKSISDFVTKSVDEDGIVTYLKENKFI